MSKFGKEIAIGTFPVLIIFLAFIGLNIVPILFICAIGTILFVMARGRSNAGSGIGIDRKGKAPAFLTFDEIGGQDRAKVELREALDFLIRREEISKFGIRPLKGILLTGPPGTGKTLMAKAAAHYTDSVFIATAGSEFVEMYVGVGASRVREVFKEARTRAENEKKDSVIIFIDEIEIIGGKRDGGQQREYDQTLNQLLTEMDGIHNSDSPLILIIAATNRKEMLDSALTRPGRFDRHIQVDLPDKKGRQHILSIHGKNKPLAEGVNLERIAEESFGFSGAHLESVMNEAAIYALRDQMEQIDQKHLSLAIDKVMLGEKSDRETTNEERERIAYHELGHAITAEALKPGTVSQVSLSPRGQAMGFVRHNPQEDQYLYSQTFLEERIMIALSGAVAEEMFYGNRSTGSRNDFELVLQYIATMMDSGLTRLGIIDRQMVTTEVLMHENTAIIEQLAKKTRDLLGRYKDIFQPMLAILIKEEVLSGDQFRELLHLHRVGIPV